MQINFFDLGVPPRSQIDLHTTNASALHQSIDVRGLVVFIRIDANPLLNCSEQLMVRYLTIMRRQPARPVLPTQRRAFCAPASSTSFMGPERSIVCCSLCIQRRAAPLQFHTFNILDSLAAIPYALPACSGNRKRGTMSVNHGQTTLKSTLRLSMKSRFTFQGNLRTFHRNLGTFHEIYEHFGEICFRSPEMYTFPLKST